MDHKTLIANLDAQDRAALTERSDRAGLMHLAGYLAVIALGVVWIAKGWPLWWLVLVPHGIVLVLLFTLAHECTHKTPFATGWINEVCGHIAGVILLLPFTWFRLFHLAHHKFTNDPDRDPELLGPKPDTWWRFVIHVSGYPIGGAWVSGL